VAARPIREIEGFVERDARDWAIGRVVREAEPVRAAFSESDGQVLQSAIDYPDVGLDFFDLSCSCCAVQEAREMASSVQRTALRRPVVQICVIPNPDR
jgi:glycopeptidolipid biosynthesis protein